MRVSKTFRFLALVSMLPLLSGCFTTIVSHEAIGSESDWFSPTALYKSKASGKLAVAGTLVKAGKRNGVPAYLVIPQQVLVVAHLQNNSDVSFRDIASLPPRMRQELHLRKKLTPDYEKIASIQNQGGIDVNQRITVNIKAVGLLPFAFVVDAIAFPLEIYGATKMVNIQ